MNNCFLVGVSDLGMWLTAITDVIVWGVNVVFGYAKIVVVVALGVCATLKTLSILRRIGLKYLASIDVYGARQSSAYDVDDDFYNKERSRLADTMGISEAEFIDRYGDGGSYYRSDRFRDDWDAIESEWHKDDEAEEQKREAEEAEYWANYDPEAEEARYWDDMEALDKKREAEEAEYWANYDPEAEED